MKTCADFYISLVFVLPNKIYKRINIPVFEVGGGWWKPFTQFINERILLRAKKYLRNILLTLHEKKGPSREWQSRLDGNFSGGLNCTINRILRNFKFQSLFKSFCLQSYWNLSPRRLVSLGRFYPYSLGSYYSWKFFFYFG